MINQLNALDINSGGSIIVFARNNISKIDVLLSNFFEKIQFAP